MKKRITTFILCAAMCFTLLSPSVAASEQAATFDTHKGFDTLSYSQQDYHASNVAARQSDETQVESLITGFLASTKASIRDPESYDNETGFIAKASYNDGAIAYRLTEAEYRRALNDAMGWKITSDSLSFNSYNAKISGTSATASIVEDYTYYVTDGFDGENFRRREYTFNLEKDSSGWEITNIKTNDPWELQEDFVYEPIDVQKEISNLVEANKLASSAKISQATDEKVATAAATALNRWTYSTNDAAAYAVAHYSDTSNSTFGYTSGNDCQNFASQCVWAGLGGSGTSTSARPAVSTAVAGSNGPNVWQRSVATTCYSSSTYWLNWTWDNTRGFANMMKVSSTTLEGPYGNTQYSGYFGYAGVGNVLIVDWDGSPARDTLDHAMVVTDVSGTSGSRTTSQVKVAAHTSATNSAYETVAAYTGMSASAFARVVISAGYYSTTQP